MMAELPQSPSAHLPSNALQNASALSVNCLNANAKSRVKRTLHWESASASGGCGRWPPTPRSRESPRTLSLQELIGLGG